MDDLTPRFDIEAGSGRACLTEEQSVEIRELVEAKTPAGEDILFSDIMGAIREVAPDVADKIASGAEALGEHYVRPVYLRKLTSGLDQLLEHKRLELEQ